MLWPCHACACILWGICIATCMCVRRRARLPRAGVAGAAGCAARPGPLAARPRARAVRPGRRPGAHTLFDDEKRCCAVTCKLTESLTFPCAVHPSHQLWLVTNSICPRLRWSCRTAAVTPNCTMQMRNFCYDQARTSLLCMQATAAEAPAQQGRRSGARAFARCSGQGADARAVTDALWGLLLGYLHALLPGRACSLRPDCMLD